MTPGTHPVALPLLRHFRAALAALALAAPAAAQTPAAPLTLADVVGLALRNNPTTRAAYVQAEAAAATYGSARGSYFPSLTLDVPFSHSRGLQAAGGAAPVERTQVAPGVSLSYLLFDFGGRSGSVARAREAAAAAAERSSAAAQATVLQAQRAYFGFNAARDVLGAQSANLRMATEARDAAVQRWRVGLATVADTLQAATALAQAQLALLTAEGELQAARGELAAAMGTRADAPFEVAAAEDPLPLQEVAAGVDSLIARAMRERPDLAAAQAQATGADAGIRVARASMLPSLIVYGNAGRTLADFAQPEGNTYGLGLGIQLPLFSGFSRSYDLRAARAQAEAATALVDAARVQVANQVYTSHATLRVATARVQAAAQLLASAVASEEVARGRYREGVGTLIDLLAAQAALASARAQEAQSRWLWRNALTQLAHDVGSLDRSGDPGLPLAPSPTPAAR